MRVLLLSTITVMALAVRVGAGEQNPLQPGSPGPPAPSFAVASVKVNTSGDIGTTALPQPGGVNLVNMPLRQIILRAYQLQDAQLIGGPDWIRSTRFDIRAKADGAPVPGQTPAMLRNLLADRFKLIVRTEKRELPIYALVLARPNERLGRHLQKSTVDCAAQLASANRSGAVPAGAPDGQSQCGGNTRPGRIAMNGTSMTQLSAMLSQSVRRIVVDRTGLSGGYDIDLAWTTDDPQGPLPPDVPRQQSNPESGSIFTALQEQLGLKLESERGPVDVIVIERVEPPTEN